MEKQNQTAPNTHSPHTQQPASEPKMASALAALLSLSSAAAATGASTLTVGANGALEVNGKPWFNAGNVSTRLVLCVRS